METKKYSDINPYFGRVRLEVRNSPYSGDRVQILSPEGEVLQVHKGMRLQDEDRFMKIFRADSEKVFNMSAAGRKAFLILCCAVADAGTACERLCLSFSVAKAIWRGLTERSYRRGIADLVEQDVIYPAPGQGFYWINPNSVWNGDRVKFSKGCVIEDSVGEIPPAGGRYVAKPNNRF